MLARTLIRVATVAALFLATSCCHTQSPTAGVKTAKLPALDEQCSSKTEVVFELGRCCGWAREREAHYRNQTASELSESKEAAFMDFTDFFGVPLYGTIHNEPAENVLPEALRRYKLLAHVLHADTTDLPQDNLQPPSGGDRWQAVREVIEKAKQLVVTIDAADAHKGP